MTGILDNSWMLQLELKLRRSAGNAFQTFFSDVMEARFGDDFIRVKPYGQLGDKGCDGYLKSTGSVFACYGAQNGSAGSVNELINKMNNDFDKAKSSLNKIMKSWKMTHNIIEGIPTDAIFAIKKLEEDNPDIEFSFFGMQSIAEIMMGLPESKLEKLIGPPARIKDFKNLQLSEVKELIDTLVSKLNSPKPMVEKIERVSPKKIEYNKLSASWVTILQAGRLNEHRIEEYLNQHHIPTQGESLAKIFRDWYIELDTQEISSDNIMYALYTKIISPEDEDVSRKIAAYTLLSYLFERCDIFKNPEEEKIS
ncbi:MAG: hypothetical protein F4044_08405 [Rhodobacteraceae bacterium]|nr:hypothetical protein [Paracoccaceae bacterium]